jgi:guanylate kinase
MDKQRGTLLVVSGPAGSGKGTVLGILLQNAEKYVYSVSATTRSPRPGEVDGKRYFFLTKEKFLLVLFEFCPIFLK